MSSPQLEISSLSAQQNLKDFIFFFAFWKALAKSKGSFVVKVGWDLAFQNHRNSNQRYPLSHQKLVNYMRKVVTDEFIGSSSVLDRHLQV